MMGRPARSALLPYASVVRSGRELRTLAGHTRGLSGVALSADGKLAVSASGGRTLKVWEVASGRELRTLAGYPGGVGGVALSADGKLAGFPPRGPTLGA